ncbi:hypothetical protein GOBAR_DD31821 [Gossypium barbadense]|nr:hypothetical protein GOBAR_DD31821 [Gossypium barbadense]
MESTSFVLAIFHILYCITTYVLGSYKMKTWKTWESEAKTDNYQYYNDPERFRFVRDTSFGRRHLNFWIRKVDYLTLRRGFIMAHFHPEKETQFEFQNYIEKSLEEDFKVVVGIRLMGTKMRSTIFDQRITDSLKNWHHTAKENTNHGKLSKNTTPFSSKPATPTHRMSPVHLLHGYPRKSEESGHTSLTHSNFENDRWDPEDMFTNSSSHRDIDVPDVSRGGLQSERREVADVTVQEFRALEMASMSPQIP